MQPQELSSKGSKTTVLISVVIFVVMLGLLYTAYTTQHKQELLYTFMILAPLFTILGIFLLRYTTKVVLHDTYIECDPLIGEAYQIPLSDIQKVKSLLLKRTRYNWVVAQDQRGVPTKLLFLRFKFFGMPEDTAEDLRDACDL